MKIYGQFPTHSVKFTARDGFHIEILDPTGSVAERRQATPANEAELIEILESGDAIVEVAGPTHRGSEAMRRSGSPYYREPPERIRVPPLSRAEIHYLRENVHDTRKTAGPHFLPGSEH